MPPAESFDEGGLLSPPSVLIVTRHGTAMTARPGPFRIFTRDEDVALNDSSPDRRFSCGNYNSCLSLAAALNWDSFTCRGCSGAIDETIRWRAKGESRRDASLKSLCNIPNPPVVFSATGALNAAVKRNTPPALRSIQTRMNKEVNNG